MRKSLTQFLIFVCLALVTSAFGQDKLVDWSAKFDPADVRAGEAGRLLVTAKVQPGWHIYKLKQDGGPIPTTIKVDPLDVLEDVREPIEPAAEVKQDPNFGIQVGWHSGEVVFSVPVKLKAGLSGSVKITVEAQAQACNDSSCAPPEPALLTVEIPIQEGAARPERTAAMTAVPMQPTKTGEASPPSKSVEPGNPKQVNGPAKASDDFSKSVDEAKSRGLWAFILLAFTAGLAALTTPCVFPMIPITVSFFSKFQDGEKRSNLPGATAYSIGIIATFTVLGLVTTALLGATGISDLSTNAYVNIFLATLFVVLSANLFGLFEIVVPSKLITKLSSKGRTSGGYVGPVLMAVAFTLTSFTCTVPFVGTILVTATQGDYLYPIVGMLAFSTAFALPFFFLAMFPQYLAKLPKSGSWLSTVKATMGFLELAAALKFISNVDLVWQWGLITKPIFLSVWATLAFLTALYLLGWIRLGHDDERPKVGWIRRGFGVAAVVGGVYCLAALEGLSLGQLDAFTPPDPYPGHKAKGEQTIAWLTDFEMAKTKAKAEGKAIFINFTGVTCTNCRWMEKNMLPRKDVAGLINQMVPVELYTDRPTAEDKSNQDLKKKLANVVTNPVYMVVKPDGTVVRVFQGSTPDATEYVRFLKEGIDLAKS